MKVLDNEVTIKNCGAVREGNTCALRAKEMSHSMMTLLMLRDNIGLVWKKICMSKQCHFEDVTIIPLY